MKQKILIVLICLTAYALFISILAAKVEQRKHSYINEQIDLLAAKINTTVENLKRFSMYVFEESVNTPATLSIVCSAWKADKKGRAVCREDLYKQMTPLYNRLLNYNFRQLHFHFPNSDSFLRVHSKSDYGDNLASVRYSVRAANETQKFIAGFEEGRIFNGYRFVYPLMRGSEHCGSVELSFSMGSFLNILSKLSTNDFAFVIKKSVVEGTVFEHKKTNYVVSSFSQEYMFDKDIHSSSHSDAFLNSISEKLSPLLLKGRDFGLEYKFNNKSFLVIFKTITNFQNAHVAYIISIGQDKGYEQINRDFIQFIAVSGVFVSIVIGLLLLFFGEREKLKLLSSTDMLTKTACRRALIEQIEIEMSRADRYGLPLSVVLFDIDDFKSLNDNCGHCEGDNVLKNVASLVSKTLRSSDLLGRWGGEEFVCMLPHTDSAAALAVAEKVRDAISSSRISPVRSVTASFGVATYRGAETIESFIKRADEAMYQAKRYGKNCVRLAPMLHAEDDSSTM